MDLAANYPAGSDGDARRRHHRIALGVAVSLALHALLLSAWRTSLTRPTQDEAQAPQTIAVWLRPPAPPVPLPREQAAPSERAAPAPPAHERHAPARTHPRGRTVIAVERAPERAPSPGTAPQAVVEQPARQFDLEAARRFARRIATERDPARAGTAAGQFPDPPLETETRAARAISSAYRPYCKDGVPGGLLAPLYLLAKKKDSGCRW